MIIDVFTKPKKVLCMLFEITLTKLFDFKTIKPKNMNPHKVVKVHKGEKFLRKLILCYKILCSSKLIAVTKEKGKEAQFCAFNMEFKEISDAAEKIYIQTFDKAKNVSSSFNNEIVNNHE